MANDLNKWIGIGRITKDAILSYSHSGMAICKFSIAVNKKKKKGDDYVEEVSFFNINCFSKTAESLNQYLLKGKQIGVEGELRQNRYEQDGQKKSRVEVNANNIQLLGGNDRSNNNGSFHPDPNSPSTGISTAQKANDVFNSKQEEFENDIPF